MTNFDSVVDFYAEKFAEVLKKEGFNQKMYRSMLGTSFSARVFFFKNIAPVEIFRDLVLASILEEQYQNKLTSVEEEFLKVYNGLATALLLPTYKTDTFFSFYEDASKFRYHGNYVLGKANRVISFVPNKHIALLAKDYVTVKSAEAIFSRDIKSTASDIITQILYRVDHEDTLWK